MYSKIELAKLPNYENKFLNELQILYYNQFSAKNVLGSQLYDICF